jgi:hypothetical protein
MKKNVFWNQDPSSHQRLAKESNPCNQHRPPKDNALESNPQSQHSNCENFFFLLPTTVAAKTSSKKLNMMQRRKKQKKNKIVMLVLAWKQQSVRA